jgi:hypothetical protein
MICILLIHSPTLESIRASTPNLFAANKHIQTTNTHIARESVDVSNL